MNHTTMTTLVSQALSQNAQMEDLDKLGILLAQIADLQQEADVLKDVFKNAGEGTYESALYKATVTLSQRSTYDYKQMIADMGITTAQLQQYYKPSASIAIRVTARQEIIMNRGSIFTTEEEELLKGVFKRLDHKLGITKTVPKKHLKKFQNKLNVLAYTSNKQIKE